MRPFLVYYQILRELCSEELHHLFALLVPGLTGAVPGEGEREAGDGVVYLLQPLLSNFQRLIFPDIFEQAPPLLLPAAGEKPPDNISRLMYETLLDLLVSQVCFEAGRWSVLRDISLFMAVHRCLRLRSLKSRSFRTL